MSGLLEALKDVLAVGAPLLITGAVQKHAFARLPNDAIPYLNGLIGVGIGTLISHGDLQAGVALGVAAATGATGLHQMVKIGVSFALKRKVSP